MPRLPRAFKIVKAASMLDDAPWEWKGAWCSDMPAFFSGMPSGVYDNIYDYPGDEALGKPAFSLDDSPVTWHITEPVDPTEYQNEWLGGVINIY